MPKLLKLYLILTGIPALLALAMPDLVIIGFFMLIIPGLFLSLAPTTFLWGCMYSVAFWAARSLFRPKLAAVVALALTAGALWAIPQPSQIKARAILAQYGLDEVKAAAPIRLAGDIRLESASPRGDNANRKAQGLRPYACDNRCLALLFEPGVRSVTVNSSAKLTHDQIRGGQGSLTPSARTYRLLPKGQCLDADYKPDLESRTGQFGKTMEDNRAIAAEWNVRLTNEVCLDAANPIMRHDVMLRTGRWQPPEDQGSYNTDAYYAEARSGDGKVLMRGFNLRTRALSAPLWIEGSGGMESFHFGWGRSQFPRGVSAEWEDPQKRLDAALSVRRTADMDRVLAATRAALQAAVADASLSKDAPIFKSVRDYMELLEDAGKTPADLPLVEHLIADPRLEDFGGAWLLPKVFDATDLKSLRPVIVAKLAALPIEADPRTKTLGQVLKSWPEGAFANLTVAERTLLGDVSRRRRANGLIERLADMGPAGAPLLAEIVETHQTTAANLRAIIRQDRENSAIPKEERDHGYEAHSNAASAAITGLCRLGPAARGELGRMLQLEQRSTRDGFSGRDWDRMMVRLGKPVEQVRKPKSLSGTEANYQRNLRNWLSRFDPARSCE